MIWYWKIDIVLKRYLVRFDGFWIDDFRLAEDWWKFCFWRYPWSIAEISDGDGYGYGSTIFIVKSEALERQLFLFWESSRMGSILFCFQPGFQAEGGLKSVEFSETVISEKFGFHCTGGWWTSTSTSNKSSTLSWRCTVLVECQSPLVKTLYSPIDFEGMAKFMLDVTFVCVYREGWMTSRKGVWKFVSLTGLQLGFGASCHSLSIW